MKHLALFSSLLGALCLAAPVTGWSNDHHGSGGGGGGHYSGGHYSGGHYSGGHYSGGHFSGYHSYWGSRYGVGFHHYPYFGYPYYSGYYPGYGYYSDPGVTYSYSSDPGAYGGYYNDRENSQADGANELAMDVQRALARRGFYNGAIDGDVGPATRGAIREFQYKNRLEVTGRIDRTLLHSLGVD